MINFKFHELGFIDILNDKHEIGRIEVFDGVVCCATLCFIGIEQFGIINNKMNELNIVKKNKNKFVKKYLNGVVDSY